MIVKLGPIYTRWLRLCDYCDSLISYNEPAYVDEAGAKPGWLCTYGEIDKRKHKCPMCRETVKGWPNVD